MSKKFIYLFTAVLSWAASILLIKYILNQGESAYNLIFWAAILSAPYWIYIFCKNSEKVKRITKTDIWILIGIGFINTAAANVVEIFAIKYTQAINYSFLVRTTMVFTIIFAFLFLKEKITKQKIILCVMILSGSYLLITSGKLMRFQIGDLLTILEAVLVSFGGVILGKMAVKRMGRELSSSAGILIGIFPITAIAFLNKAVAIPKLPVFVLFLALSNALIIVFKYKGYKIASAAYITMMFSLTPVVVSLIAIPLFKESLAPIQILGGGLIILGGVLCEKLRI
ncbi:MAG: DMT family transporter [bacterium]